MHHTVKNFYLTGIITGDKFVQTRQRLIDEVEAGMRDEGYVPMLDLVPQFTRKYNAADDTFTFELTVYGAYVGDKAWQISGVTDGKIIMKSTRLIK